MERPGNSQEYGSALGLYSYDDIADQLGKYASPQVVLDIVVTFTMTGSFI